MALAGKGDQDRRKRACNAPAGGRMFGALRSLQLILGSAFQVSQIVASAVHDPIWPGRRNPAITEVGRWRGGREYRNERRAIPKRHLWRIDGDRCFLDGGRMV